MTLVGHRSHGQMLVTERAFCSSAKEELYQLFFECSHSQIFWKAFSFWWFELVKENITVSLKDIILVLLNRTDIMEPIILG